MSLWENQFSGRVRNFNQQPILESDMNYPLVAGFPFYFIAIMSGTLSATPGELGHPGIVSIRTSTSANSGVGIKLRSESLFVGGGEEYLSIFKIFSLKDDNIFYLGFQTDVVVLDPTDGAFIKLIGGVFYAKCINNSSVTVAGTTYNAVQGVWYRPEVKVNSDGSRVDFYLYDCVTGNLLWREFIITNIPLGRNVGVGSAFININTALTTQYIALIDYQRYKCDRILIR